MDVFNEELISFWTCLNKFEVKYIMVGGVAINFNGYQRATDDIDVWIEDTTTNRKKFKSAFLEYTGTDYFMVDTMRILAGWTNFNLNNGYRLDLMVDMKGLEGFTFDECLELASIAEVFNLKVPFLHINHLIANKKAVNRPKDQLDVFYLEKIKKLREEDKIKDE